MISAPAMVAPARLAAALTVAMALLVPAAAPAQSSASIERRLNTMQAEVDSIRRSLGLPAAQSGGSAAAAALRRLDLVEQELARLTGEMERLRYRVDQIADDATRRFGDVEFRLTELEGGDIAALPTTPVPVGGDTTPAATGTGTAVAAVSVSEQRDLDQAIALIQRGDLAEAQSALQAFVGAYPGSPLLPAAQFYRGEAAFTQGDYRTAARAYLDGFNTDPQGARAADNLMKLGVSLGRLGQQEQACSTLREVEARFAGNDRVVAEASGEAERLSCG
ncbi:MAG: tol-pal system protein YbgF [Pseudomonadota bacterium]